MRRASVWIAAATGLALLAATSSASPPSQLQSGPRIGGGAFGRGPMGSGYNAMGGALIRRPAVSPYLNILRNDGLGPLNYQTMVRPQIEARNAYLRQAAELRGIESELRNRRRPGDEPGQMRETGHGTSFFNYSHYFPGAGS